MHIEPVMPNFQYVKIRRSGGILGVDQTLQVDQHLAATVVDRDREHAFQLDAYSAQELMNALARLATERPAASDHEGYDLFQYDIELAWGGNVYHVSSVDLGADEALHGVMLAARGLLDEPRDSVHVMSLHTQPHVDAPTPA